MLSDCYKPDRTSISEMNCAAFSHWLIFLYFNLDVKIYNIIWVMLRRGSIFDRVLIFGRALILERALILWITDFSGTLNL